MNRNLIWKKDAKCNGIDTDLFFPTNKDEEEIAVQFCEGCPVISACLAYALKTSQDNGVWGGTTASERRRMHSAARKRIA